MLKPQCSFRPTVLRSSHEDTGRSTRSSHLERSLGALLGPGAEIKHPGKDKESKHVGEQCVTSWDCAEPHTDKPCCKYAAGHLNRW